MSPHAPDTDRSPATPVIEGVAQPANEPPPHDSKSEKYTAPDDGSEPEDGYDYIPLTIESLERATSISELLRAKGCSDPGWADAIAKGNPKFESPFEWSVPRKLRTLAAPFLASTLAAYAAGSYAMAVEPLTEKWGVSSTVYSIGITMFVLGFGLAPMILAPVSENHGRYWVFVGAGVLFTAGTIGCAFTASLAGMLVARFVTGCGASVFATLTAGVASDLYHKQDRNTPMTLFSLTVMAGAGIGPLVSGALNDYLGWRWVFYLQIILVGGNTLLILLFFAETRANVILERLCRELNRHSETALGQDPRRPRHSQPIRFAADTVQQEFSVAMIWRSFAFPLRLLATESVVFWFSAWASFGWAILYLQFNSIGIVFRETYDFTTAQVGFVYAAVIIGSVLVAALSIFQESFLCRVWPERMATPEGRLLPSCLESTMLPIGLFWFGWSAQGHAHWTVPVLAVGSCTVGIFSIYLAVFNYLADTYHRYASSALAAQSMCRNLLAGIFPLVAHRMFHDLSYGAASSLLGGIGILLTAVPWLLCIYGETVRSRSPFASNMKGADAGVEEIERRNSEEV